MKLKTIAAMIVMIGLLGGSAPAIVPDPEVPAVPDGPYQTNWDSLTKHPVPEWFRDAKFGIYTHWGVYAVPEFGTEWYPRNMYIDGSPEQKHHQEVYGDLSKFGYKDFIPMFKAEKFNADEWADLFVKAGAKFAGPVAEHHDGFSMWASKVNRWNAKDMGPKRDVVGELTRAIRKRNLKVITSFHHAFNIYGYYTAKEGWDTGNPEYADLYGQIKDRKTAHDRWLVKMIEVIDAYQPDQLWFDFCIRNIPDDYKQKMAAYYYNRAAEWGREVIITRKGMDLPLGVGVLDIERGREGALTDYLWQTDDSVAWNSWCYVKNLDVKSAVEMVHELIDIVSKNGILLLNVAPKSDGTIPDDQKELLLEMGRWLDVNGEAIYGTRPWKIFGENPKEGDSGSASDASSVEIRFTRKGNDVYAICLGWPEKKLLINTLRVQKADPSAKITLLGYGEPLPFEINEQKQALVEFPNPAEDKRPSKYAYTLKLTGFELGVGEFYSKMILPADKAVLDGGKIKLENKGDDPNIGYWDNGNDSVHWLLKVPEAGTYSVRGVFAAGAGASRLKLSAEGPSIVFDVPASSNWSAGSLIDVGELTFDKPGIHHVILSAADPSTWKPVNVWELRLAPKD